MRSLIWFFLGLLPTGVFAHGGHMATFSYQLTDTYIVLDFRIEQEIIEHLGLDKSCASYQQTSALCLTKYIQEKVDFQLNDCEVAFALEEARVAKGIFHLKLMARGDFSQAGTLELKNTCFFSYDKKFENRVIVQKGAFAKSYRLSASHPQIKLNPYL
ncbi:MAG: hypothetical protein AAFR61_14120 [Bacteroidota bacterium]